MTIIRAAVLLGTVAVVSACAVPADKSRDRFVDTKNLTDLQAGIWVDPNGCDHWIIDDGLEGYLSQRLDRSGKPVCSGAAPSGVATGPFKEGSSVPDLM